MTGKRYYLTNFAAWQRNAHHCAETHFVILEVPRENGSAPVGGSRPGAASSPAAGRELILAVITADEAAHISLETDPEFEPLPHPLSRTPVSERVAAALAPLGVIPGDDTFTIAEKISRVNPLLRYRVF